MKSWVRIALSSLLLVSIASFADSAKKPNVDPNSIAVAPGSQTFIIRLSSNPGSTGYNLYLSHYDHSLIAPVSYSFTPNTASEIIGAPGVTTWTFRVKPLAKLVPQVTNIQFAVAQPWDAKTMMYKNVKVFLSPAN